MRSRVKPAKCQALLLPLLASLVLVAGAALVAVHGTRAAMTSEPNIDRPGADLSSIELQQADPTLCSQACEAQTQCMAYTYVKPGLQGPKARCWLKSSVPPPVSSTCCSSGVKTAAMDYWVGVLLVGNKCPAGTFKVSFYLDMEDVGQGLSLPLIGAGEPFTSWANGFDSHWTERNASWNPPNGKGLAGSGYRFTWCRVDGKVFKPLTTDYSNVGNAYSVLKLSANCPPGSIDRGIYMDTEDSNPNNNSSGNITPNSVKANNATLRFCQFQSASNPTATMGSFPELKDDAGATVSYAVLHDFDGAQPPWIKNKKYVYFDDEDDDCETKYLEKPPPIVLNWDPYAIFSSMVQRFKAYGDWGTFFEFAQVH